MPKLHWYNYEEGKGLPEHSEWVPEDKEIYIRADDPRMESHAALAHELAHWEEGATEATLSEEIRAWEVAIRNLVKVGGWTPEVKEQAIWALGGYFGEFGSERPDSEARWWINRMEARARGR